MKSWRTILAREAPMAVRMAISRGARRAANQHERGDIHAGNQQDHGDGTEQGLADGAEIAQVAVAQRHEDRRGRVLLPPS